MSSAVVFNTVTGTVEVQETGRPGPAGLIWRDQGWVDGERYQRNQALEHRGTSYRALSEHVAAPETEPGVGVDWEMVWQVLALGADVDDVEIVAGIAAEIVAVASIKDDVEAVAAVTGEITTVAGISAEVEVVSGVAGQVATVSGIAPEVQTVAGIAAQTSAVAAIDDDVVAVASAADDVRAVAPAVDDVHIVANNLPAIQAAPQAATDAAEARDQAQAWAEGHEPGGTGTKSSKVYAEDAADSAATASAATLVGYGVSIYNATGIEPGGYYADRRAANDSVQDRLYVEIIAGDPGSTAEINVEVAGDTVYGPITVTAGTPLDLGGLSMAVPAGAGIGFLLIQTAGTVTELFAKTYGAVA